VASKIPQKIKEIKKYKVPEVNYAFQKQQQVKHK